MESLLDNPEYYDQFGRLKFVLSRLFPNYITFCFWDNGLLFRKQNRYSHPANASLGEGLLWFDIPNWDTISDQPVASDSPADIGATAYQFSANCTECSCKNSSPGKHCQDNCR